MTQDLDADVIVVGGGISGLASARGLQQRGARVVCWKRRRARRAIGSSREQGCLLESGPNSALETTPLIGPLLNELGIAGERIDANAAARNGIFCATAADRLPLSPSAFFATRLFSTRAKLRLFCEPFIGRGAPDAEETVADFVRRRLGTELLDYAINPFVGGVYGGNPATLSVSAAFPRLHELEQQHGSLIWGQLAGARERARNPEKSKQSAPMFAFREGMQTLTDAIAQRLARVELATEVVSVVPRRGSYVVTASNATGARIPCPRCCSRRPRAPRPARRAVCRRRRGALEGLYPPVAVAFSVYRRSAVAHALDGFGMLIPECERRQILGTIFSSALFENRSPGGLVLLTSFIGGTRQSELALRDEQAIANLVQSELAALLGISANPEFVRVRRWPRAIPQYTLGHAERIGQVAAAERNFPGLFFCANYRGGISIGDCIKSADHAADQVAAFLRGA